MNYENFNSCDNLGDTFEYMEVKETTATIEDLEELELFKTVARCGLIKEDAFYKMKMRGTPVNYNIKQELKDLGVKVSVKSGDTFYTATVTVKSKEDLKTKILNILNTYLTIDHTFDEKKGEYPHNPKGKYGSLRSIILKYNESEDRVWGYHYYD